MWFKRTDKLFAKAATDSAQCDRLIQYYRRVRVGMFGLFVLTCGTLIAFAIWFFVQTFHFLAAMGGGRAEYMPPSLDFVLNSGGKLWLVVILVAVIGVACLLAAVAADGMAKMLLMFRTLQNAESATARD